MLDLHCEQLCCRFSRIDTVYRMNGLKHSESFVSVANAELDEMLRCEMPQQWLVNLLAFQSSIVLAETDSDGPLRRVAVGNGAAGGRQRARGQWRTSAQRW